MRVAVVVNLSARRARRPGLRTQIIEGFARRGVDARVELCSSTEVASALEGVVQSSPDAIVAGGGDGTISSAAECCFRAGLPLGVLPLGTWNHFAHDLRLPTSVEGAAECIAAAKTVRIDIGCVNGRAFVNNSSIGAYPRAVQQRDQLRERFGIRKHLAAVLGILRVFARRPLLVSSMEVDGTRVQATTPFVFVGNNPYDVSLFSIRLRSSLNSGRLCVYTTRCTGLAGLAKLLGLALCRSLEQSRDFERRSCAELVIHLSQSTIRVANDGELVRMTTPLKYRIIPAALEVFVS